MKIRKRNIFVFILVIFSVGAAVWAFKAKHGKTSDKATEEISPQIGSIRTFISTAGTVQPQNRLELKPPISGRIEEILVKEGDTVKRGDTVAWMSSTERAAILDAARARGEKTLSEWQETYKPTPLIAPIDGEVIVRAVEQGQTITPSEAVIVLSDRLIVKAQVDETDVGKVALNQTAVISLDAYPDVKVNAKVDHISYESKIINNVTIYEVDILPEKVPEAFRSGMSADVKILEKNKGNVLIIPLAAVRQRKDGNFVLVKEEGTGKTSERKVELGISDDKNVEVVSGLTEKDTIIVTALYLPSNKEPATNPFMPFGRRRR